MFLSICESVITLFFVDIQRLLIIEFDYIHVSLNDSIIIVGVALYRNLLIISFEGLHGQKIIKISNIQSTKNRTI